MIYNFYTVSSENYRNITPYSVCYVDMLAGVLHERKMVTNKEDKHAN